MPGALPPAGVEFPVHLGSSFGAEGSEGPGLCLLQYHFKPASAGRLRTGQIKLQPEHQQVLLQLPQTSNSTSNLDFAGTYEPSKDGFDCLASFDGTCWRLDLVTASARNLKNTQNVFPQQPPAVQAHAVPASDSDAVEHIQPRSASPPERLEQDQLSEENDADLTKELDDALAEEAEGAASPVKGDSPEPRQQRGSSVGGSSSPSAEDHASKPQQPKQAQARSDAGALRDMEREFMGGGDSDSEVDEEELNRCSDDEVDAFDS